MSSAESDELSQKLREIDEMINAYVARISVNAAHGFTLDAIKSAWFGAQQKDLIALQASNSRDFQKMNTIAAEVHAIVCSKTK